MPASILQPVPSPQHCWWWYFASVVADTPCRPFRQLDHSCQQRLLWRDSPSALSFHTPLDIFSPLSPSIPSYPPSSYPSTSCAGLTPGPLFHFSSTLSYSLTPHQILYSVDPEAEIGLDSLSSVNPDSLPEDLRRAVESLKVYGPQVCARVCVFVSVCFVCQKDLQEWLLTCACCHSLWNTILVFCEVGEEISQEDTSSSVTLCL